MISLQKYRVSSAIPIGWPCAFLEGEILNEERALGTWMMKGREKVRGRSEGGLGAKTTRIRRPRLSVIIYMPPETPRKNKAQWYRGLSGALSGSP